ncbi:MAG TPA: discoidin domain-containing protein [Blastocatellia bacterium]|nr:discoidin domain-containing protein [Blastocatellia bacterium]
MTHHATQRMLNEAPSPLPIVAALIMALFATLPALAQSGNLALGRSVTRSSDVSSGRAPNAVDGNVATFWQPLMSDRQDDSMVWLTVDLGGATTFNEIVLNFRTNVANVNGFRALTSNDNATWQPAFSKFRPDQTFANIDRSSFPDVTARFARVEIVLTNPTPNFQLNELELYSSTPSLSRVFFTTTDGRALSPAETITLSVGASAPLTLRGRLTNGQDITLENATVTMTSAKPAIASVAPTGADAAIAAILQGVALITARASLDGVSREVTLWIDSFDPAMVVADLTLAHTSMETAIGRPAVIPVGSAFPSLKAHAYEKLALTGRLTRSAHTDVDGVDVVTALELPTTIILPGVPTEIALPGTADQPGLYRLSLSLQRSGRPDVYDAFTFSVLDPAQTPPGQSHIVFAGPSGRLGYAPDFKGNRPLDFSNAGYGGGGVALPNAQVRVAVTPDEGDDSARIQAAIDQVSAMPQNAEGIRGAVLLKRGRFEVGTTLVIRASGVVLRGEGRGEDGTILFATGTAKRNVLEVGGPAGRLLLPARTQIADLYAPSGARRLRLEDASVFKVGDSVLVRRVGNDRWIHAIAMDQIVEADQDVVQFTPFNLDFDRIITAIDGNTITLDAPIANAIESRWGGGEVIRYDDPDRIEHVGVEQLRVVVEFNPDVTAVNDGVTYFADEDHAATFVALDSVKNAWVREVTSQHLEHSLANVLRNAKWVTVQDCAAIDMVSLITGSRRYNFKLAGQLTLVQRNHAETARHAYVVDSRVPGPNVFLDSDSINEFATSEPHHRWSVGGLYDNIASDIAMQDRAWLGSGHGWAGANYVAWNTRGDLVAQQPPTAQNYAIGHVGRKVAGFAPNSQDPRPRQDGWWESLGQNVEPRSLYLRQLTDRLGADAAQRIERTTVVVGALDTPRVESDLPLTKGIKVDNHALAGFSSTVFEYIVTLPAGTTRVPEVRPHDNRHRFETLPASHVNGKSTLILWDKRDASKSVRYTIRFVTPGSL